MNSKIKWIIFFLVFILCVPLINKILPSFTHINFYNYYSYKNNIVAAIEDEYYFENAPMIQNNQIYLPVDLVHDYIDNYIFWDKNQNKLTITTTNNVVRMQTDDLNYYVNDEPMKLDLPIYKINEQAYMPADFLKSIYQIDVTYNENTKIVSINLNTKSHTSGKIKRNINLRYEADKKSPIAGKLNKDETVYIFSTKDKYTKIRSQSGLIGYVPTKNIIDTKKIPAIQIPSTKEKNVSKINGKIKMVWEQVTNVSANYQATLKQIPNTLNVISPTWFSFDTEKLNGDIVNLADLNYVENAHKNNCQVWALISDNFNYKVNHAVLCDTSKREHVIKQLLAYISLYNLDGINIDFEAVSKDDAKYYIQFLRELAPLMKKQNAVLSVDMFVPTSWSMYYNRVEVGKIANYICVMAYDEHTKNSEMPGTVASYEFVANGIKNTLKEVSQEKIILGIPFYVRVWRESGDGFSLKNYSMDKALEIFNSNNVKFKWLDFEKCFYGEYDTIENSETVTYKTWLEDEKSIEEKLKLAQKYNLAGVSGWKKNLEKDVIWDLIDKYMQ